MAPYCIIHNLILTTLHDRNKFLFHIFILKVYSYLIKIIIALETFYVRDHLMIDQQKADTIKS